MGLKADGNAGRIAGRTTGGNAGRKVGGNTGRNVGGTTGGNMGPNQGIAQGAKEEGAAGASVWLFSGEELNRSNTLRAEPVPMPSGRVPATRLLSSPAGSA